MGSARVNRVLLVDDHWIFRRGLRDLLEGEQDMRVVGEASSGEEALIKARGLRAGVVVMDFRMPGMDGLSAAREIRAVLPETQVVMVSASADDQDILEALTAGARGYFAKDDEPQAILQAVRDVAAGKLYLAPGLALRICRLLAQEDVVAAPRRSGHLSAREARVLGFIAAGKRNGEIAVLLGRSERTVGNDVSRILHKLQVHNRSEAIVEGVRSRIIKV